MRREPFRCAFSRHFLGRFPESQRLALREYVRQEYVVMPANRIESLGERNKVTRNQPGPLMDQLIERVLTVGSRLAPVHGAGRISNFGAIERNVFAVTLHGQLLKIGRKALQILLVGQYGNSFGA